MINVLYVDVMSCALLCSMQQHFFFNSDDFHILLLARLLSRHQFVSEGACHQDFRHRGFLLI